MKSTNKLIIARWTRIWIEQNKDINILNYCYYRYFTNRFELFLLNNLEKTL